MSNLIAIDHQLDARACTCRVIIETPRGGRGKYAYDAQTDAFALKRMLPDSMTFPLDFGFVPSTLAQDGDPLDILVLNDEPTAVGALVAVRLIGVMEAEQVESGRTFRNDRILAVAAVSHQFERVRTVEHLGEAFLRNLTHFWVTYVALRGATFRVISIGNCNKATRLIADAKPH
jgi:inorganic pyrophosphatase